MGIPVPDDSTTYLGIRRGQPRLKVAGIRVREYVRVPSTLLIRGRAVTAAAPLFIQLAKLLGLLNLVIAGDSMIRAGRTTLTLLRETATEARGQVGIRARLAAELIRPMVDSPMETWLRLLIVLAGLPEPVVNRDVISRQGGWLARPDLSYPALKSRRSSTTATTIASIGGSGATTSRAERISRRRAGSFSSSLRSTFSNGRRPPSRVGKRSSVAVAATSHPDSATTGADSDHIRPMRTA